MIPLPQRLQFPEPNRAIPPPVTANGAGRNQTPRCPPIPPRGSPHRSSIRDLLPVRNSLPGRPFSVTPPSNFRPFEHACCAGSPPLPIQCAPDNFVDWPRRITQRYVLAARAARMLALPALPASLISLKTKRAVWTSISAPRAYRRYPVVHPSLMLAVSTNRHDPSIIIC
jgi:hypothetical protein